LCSAIFSLILILYVISNFHYLNWDWYNKENKILTPAEHRLVFKREKRRGKPVTLVGEFFIDKDESKSLLKSIKKSLGSGGTFKDGWMELQGEKADAIRPLLEKVGYRFKR
jgi:translation initiation factor 1